ncbi:MAG: transcriptional repressor proteinral negative regulator of transcription subunit 4 [Sporothrix thermara]
MGGGGGGGGGGHDDRFFRGRFSAAALTTALRTTGRVWTGVSATLLVLGWLLGGVMGVALGLAGWAGVVMVQLAGYVWERVAAGDVPAKEGEEVMAVALAAAVAVE